MSRLAPTLIFLSCCLLTSGVRAQTQADIDAASRQADTIFQQQQERLRRDLENARKALPEGESTDLRTLMPKTSVPDLGATCHQIAEIRVIGAEHLATDEILAVTRPYQARCLGIGEIEAILGELTRRYIESGFVTTRVYLPAQDLGSGVLQLRVIEGVIEGYRIEGDAPGIKLPRVFPADPGDLLNLRDLEQGIDQINRLSSNNAKLDIQPGNQPGASVVVARNTRAFPAHLQLTTDNQGTDSTGKYGAAVSLTLDSLLQQSERFVFNHRESFAPNASGHESKNDALEFWQPFGYSALTVSIGRSTYLNMLTATSGLALKSEGTTDSAGIGLDRVLYRDRNKRGSVAAKLSTQDTKNYLADTLLTLSSRKLSTLDLSANGFIVTQYGMLTGQLTYSSGLDAFGALEDAASLSTDAPHAQFRKVALDLSFSRTFPLGGRELSWTSQWTGQHGYTTLYGSQQISIGGQGSVRGFLNNTLSGDHGYYWRNELSLPVAMSLGGAAMGGRAFIGYDFGAVESRAAGASEGFLSGATLGLSMQWKGLSWEVSGSRPLQLPASMTKEPARAWFRVSYSI